MTHSLDPIYTRRYRQRAKRDAIEVYGGKCACCGETNFTFLTLDHIGNTGGEHRRTDAAANRICAWARMRGYPKTLQILCANCNFGRRWNGGVCPHTGLVSYFGYEIACMYGFIPDEEIEHWVEPAEWSL